MIYEHIQQEQNIICRMPGHVPDHDDDTIPLLLEHSILMVPSMWKFPTKPFNDNSRILTWRYVNVLYSRPYFLGRFPEILA